MTNLKVIIKNKSAININVNLNQDSVNDLISKIGNITVNLITIGGENVKTEDFPKKLCNWDLEDGDIILISDYYNGGNKLKNKFIK